MKQKQNLAEREQGALTDKINEEEAKMDAPPPVWRCF
jgi:hypothetical protein